MHRATYRAIVRGDLHDEVVQELGGWRIVEQRAGATVLEGDLADQAALLGALARFEGQGCLVRDLRAVECGVASRGSS